LVRYDLDTIGFKKATADDVRPAPDPWKNTGLSGKDVQHAQLEFDSTSNRPQVLLTFNDEGKKLFAEITKRDVGKLVAIFLDGSPISIPRVQQEITDGSAVISGSFDVAEAKLLAQRLNAGALPVPITLLSQQTIGASLGQDSLQKSLYAGLIGFLIVVSFMILYYRLPGLLASLALAMYTAFSLAIFKLLGITLTLSGIAGVILSIGMAVDANILIFERLKEELRNGRPLASAIDEGFKRAWTSIRDSNVSSLITCAILYSFTSSSVRGFAVTLALGIGISMFSAITVTRSLLRLVASWTVKHPWLYNK
jgi:preprotein translocase subunit SecD